jgi:glucose 1-dehydrogenase
MMSNVPSKYSRNETRVRRTILITGASAGIGAATARLAAQQGYRVCIHYNSDLAGAQLVAGMCQAKGAETHLFRADISNPEEITSMFTEFDALDVPLDVLVNNAGIVAPASRLDEMSFERMAVMFGTNIIGPMLVAKEAILRMSQAYGGEGGAIVNLSSVAAKLGAPGEYIDYAASKGAMDTFTVGLASELALEGIRVNAVRPGIIETAIHAKGGQPDRAEVMAERVPMRRAGHAEEVAQAVLYLASHDASYVTGSILDVSGGR